MPQSRRRAIVGELYLQFAQERFTYGYFRLIVLKTLLSAHYDWLLKTQASEYEKTECSRQLVNVSIELEKHENL